MYEIDVNENSSDYLQKNATNGKRSFGTMDPDYVTAPDTKKLKSLERKGEEELCGRVVNVIEKEFSEEIDVCQSHLEEIDLKILKAQQILHTLRYLGTLQYYAFDKVKRKRQKRSPKQLLQENHPAARNSVTTSPPSTASASELLSKINEINRKIENTKNGRDLSEDTAADNNGNQMSISRFPKLPESKEVISQGRKGRLQTKLRIVVGNTYQYLQNDTDLSHELKFKWRIYVRGPPESADLSKFLSSVIYTLDSSYAPHDVITIREHPFSLSRRGWGEFKVKLELQFHDKRNKPVHLFHSLRLSRGDDPLALTGIWRPGEESWYDVWLYDKDAKRPEEEQQLKVPLCNPPKSLLESMGANGIITKTVYKDDFGNTTLSHDFIKQEPEDRPVLKKVQTKDVKSDTVDIKPLLRRNGDIIPMQIKTVVKAKDSLVNKKSTRPNLVDSTASVNPSTITESNNRKNNLSPHRVPFINQPNLNKSLSLLNSDVSKVKSCDEKSEWKILVRQSCGRLVYTTVSKEIYQMAVQLSEKNMNKGTKVLKKPTETDFNSKSTADAAVKSCKTFVLKSNSNNPSPAPIKVKNIISMSPKDTLPKLVPPNSILPPQSPGSYTKFQFQSTTNNGTLIESSCNPRSPSTKVNIFQPNKVFKTVDGNKFVLTSSPSTVLPKVGNFTMSANNNLAKIVSIPNGKKIILKMPPTSSNLKLLNKAPKQTLTMKLADVRNGGVQLKIKTNIFSLNNVSNGNKLNVGDSSIRKITLKSTSKAAKKNNNCALITNHPAANNIIPKDNSKLKTASALKKLIAMSQSSDDLSSKFIDRVRAVKKLCENLKTCEEVMNLYMKKIPLFGEESNFWEFSQVFCVPSSKRFSSLPCGRQSAAEVWRAREILKTIRHLKLNDSQNLNIRKIVQWSQKHGYSGSIKMRNKAALMKIAREIRIPDCSSLSLAENVSSPTKHERLHEDVVIDVDDSILPTSSIKREINEENNLSNKKKLNQESTFMEIPETTKACDFIGWSLAKLRLKLPPEEIVPGVYMNLSKNVMWSATMSFMEELLRCSSAAAMEERGLGIDSPSSNIDKWKSNRKTEADSVSALKEEGPTNSSDVIVQCKHVGMALAKGRPQFEMFSQCSLAKNIQVLRSLKREF